MAIKRKNPFKGNKRDRRIALHYDYNNVLRESLNTILNQIKRIEEIDEVEKEEVLGFFSNWTGAGKSPGLGTAGNLNLKNNQKGFLSWIGSSDIAQIKTIFNKLEQDLPEVERMIQSMISVIDSENQEIQSFLSKDSIDIIQLDSLVQKLDTKYNSEKYRLWEQIRLKLGQEDTIEKELQERVTKSEEQIINTYVELYENLVSLVKTDASKNEMKWDGIYRILRDIVEGLSHIKGSKYKDTLLEIIDKKRDGIKSFTNNFFIHPETFSNYFKVHQEVFKEHNVYSNIPEDDRKTIDKRLNEALILLFNGVKSVLDKIKDEAESKDEDFEKIKKEFERVYALVQDKLRTEKNFVGKLENCGIYGEDGITEGMSFNDFRNTFLKPGIGNKAKIEQIKNYLLALNTKKVTFDKFKSGNISQFSDGVGGTNLGKNLDDDEIKKLKEEFLEKVKEVAIFIKKIKHSNEGDNTEQVVSDLNNAVKYFLDLSSDENERKEIFRELFSRGFEVSITDTDIQNILTFSESIFKSPDIGNKFNAALGLLNEFSRLKVFSESIESFINKS